MFSGYNSEIYPSPSISDGACIFAAEAPFAGDGTTGWQAFNTDVTVDEGVIGSDYETALDDHSDEVEFTVSAELAAPSGADALTARDIQLRSLSLSTILINRDGAPRSVVEIEDYRIATLLNERSVGSDELGDNDSRIESPRQSERDAVAAVAAKLAISRELIKDSIIKGVDDVAVDTRLGLRTDSAIVPPLFRELHRRAEAQAGQKITFLTWMTDYATDDQLLNVWQWHDKYLKDLNNDPAFQERVASVKKRYVEGSRQAIAAGTLHPAMTVWKREMNVLRITHGSPFSPLLAVHDAYADRNTSEVRIRPSTSNFTLYHEMAHLLNGGLYPQFDEGATDLLAAEIYNQTHPDEYIDPRCGVYGDQIATLDVFNRMTGGKLDVFELSRIYAGLDSDRNMMQLATSIDDAAGLPITASLMQSSREIFEKGMGDYDGAAVLIAAQIIERRSVELLAELLFDNTGNRIAGTPQAFVLRILSPDMLAKYELYIVAHALKILLRAIEQQNN